MLAGLCEQLIEVTMLASKFDYQLLNLQVKCKIEFLKWTNPD